jgi:RNA methyltransferase, TrmH family
MSEPLGSNNPRIQLLRRLTGRRSARLEEGLFLVEGPTLVAEAVASGWPLQAVYVEESALSLLPVGVRPTLVRDGVLARVMSVEAPRPIVAVAELRSLPLPVSPSFVIVGAGLSDPGNLGTILRTAEAAGADGIVLLPGSVDPFSPKVVRSSAGAIFRLPIVLDGDPGSVGLPLWGTVAHGGVPYDQADLRRPLALVLGNEAHGLPGHVVLDGLLTIPQVGQAESLNVAMAAAVLCFEVARQRRSA